MSSAEKAQVAKQGVSVDTNFLLPYLSELHNTTVCTALYDRAHYTWLSERAHPAGVILLDGTAAALPYPVAVPDVGTAAAVVAQAFTQAAAEDAGGTVAPQPIILLEYLAGVNALQQKGGSAGSGSSTCGHVQPLVPAPDWLLKGPQHPCYPMEPTFWAPFRASAHMAHFLTPYHRGVFNTTDNVEAQVQLGAIDGRGPLHPSRANGPFKGAVYLGSVVAFRHAGGAESQGIVLLTFVRMSQQKGTNWAGALKTLGCPMEPGDALSQVNASSVPVPQVCVLRLRPPTGGDRAGLVQQCWQDTAVDEPNPLEIVKCSDVTYIFRSNQLGKLGAPAKKQVLQHRMQVTAKFISVPDPAAPSPLRDALDSDAVAEAILLFMRASLNSERPGSGAIESSTAASSGAGGEQNLLLHFRARSSFAYPIDTLLCARARQNCAHPLTLPGVIQRKDLESDQLQSEGMQVTLNVGDKFAATSSGGTKTRPPGSGSSGKGGKSHSGKPESGASGSGETSGGTAGSGQLGSSTAGDKHDSSTAGSRKGGTGSSGGGNHQSDESGEDDPRSHDRRPVSSSKLSSATRKLVRALFDALSDAHVPEYMAPLAAIVMNQLIDDHDVNHTPLPTGSALDKEVQKWRKFVFEELVASKSADQELLALLCEHAGNEDEVAAVCNALADPTWRDKTPISKRTKGKGVKRDVIPWFDAPQGVRPSDKSLSLHEKHLKQYAELQRKRAQGAAKAAEAKLSAGSGDAAACSSKASSTSQSKLKRGASQLDAGDEEAPQDGSDEDEAHPRKKARKDKAGSSAGKSAAASRGKAKRETAKASEQQAREKGEKGAAAGSRGHSKGATSSTRGQRADVRDQLSLAHDRESLSSARSESHGRSTNPSASPAPASSGEDADPDGQIAKLKAYKAQLEKQNAAKKAAAVRKANLQAEVAALEQERDQIEGPGDDTNTQQGVTGQVQTQRARSTTPPLNLPHLRTSKGKKAAASGASALSDPVVTITQSALQEMVQLFCHTLS
jgi:hypothetical protein